MIIQHALRIATLVGVAWLGLKTIPAYAQSVAVDNSYVYVVRGNTLYQYDKTDMKLWKQTTLPPAKSVQAARYPRRSAYSKRQRVVRSSPTRRRSVRTQRLARAYRSVPLPP